MISIQYSGTGALKTDFTRTGKRTKLGAMKDGLNSLTRYYKNNFADGYRQVDKSWKHFSLFQWYNNISCYTGFAGAIFRSLYCSGRWMHFHSMSFGVRAKLALYYIPACFSSRVFDAGGSHNLTIAIYNGNITLYTLLGRHGGRHLRHYYPSWQAIRRQAKITLELINILWNFKLYILYNMDNRWQ